MAICRGTGLGASIHAVFGHATLKIAIRCGSRGNEKTGARGRPNCFEEE
jgi:hypothetical protein